MTLIQSDESYLIKTTYGADMHELIPTKNKQLII